MKMRDYLRLTFCDRLHANFELCDGISSRIERKKLENPFYLFIWGPSRVFNLLSNNMFGNLVILYL